MHKWPSPKLDELRCHIIISKESIRFVFVKYIQNTTPYQGSLFFNNYKFNKKFIATWKCSHIEVTQKQLEQYFSN